MAEGITKKRLGVATEDCRTCKRRRITCDRSLPVCRKCGTRSLECPGYGVKFKWVGVTATRGSLNDNAIPSSRGISNTTLGKDAFVTLPSPTRPCPTQSCPMQSRTKPNAHYLPTYKGCLLANHRCYTIYTIDPEADALHRQLIHHYNHVVAPQMVWIDSVQNPFRQITMPLAFESPTLMMSILSVAAGDLWTRSHSGFHKTTDVSQPWDKYEKQALEHLANHLKDENTLGQESMIKPPPDTDLASPILAAFLLGSLAMKLGDSGVWRLHLRAAWTMLEHWHSCPSRWSLSVDAVKEFLWQEVYASKVWESITTFQSFDGLYESGHNFEREAPFFHYVGVIRSLVEIERRLSTNEALTSDMISMTSLETKLDKAKQRTQRCTESLTFPSPQARIAFECVVEMFHHAGLLYASHVLPQDDLSRNVVDRSRIRLFMPLKDLEVTDIIAQDLTWPIFIAGTECQGCRKRQTLVWERMLQIMQLSGALERPRLLDFLSSLWELQSRDPQTSWIRLARIWAERGEPILII